MSAFVMTLDRLIPAVKAYETGQLNFHISKQVLLLHNYNVRSVNTRYSLKGGYQTTKSILVDILKHEYTEIQAMQALKTLDCLEYQSCETKTYYDCAAYHYLLKVREYWYRRLLEEQGVYAHGGIYYDATWG
jgi:hypothetical protein